MKHQDEAQCDKRRENQALEFVALRTFTILSSLVSFRSLGIAFSALWGLAFFIEAWALGAVILEFALPHVAIPEQLLSKCRAEKQSEKSNNGS